jgi:hypothetical protein
MYLVRQGYPAPDREARTENFGDRFARDAAGPTRRVMMRRLHFAFFIALVAIGAVPGSGAAPGSVSGVVRNSAGVPQIGAIVQLLRPDLSVFAVVYTNDEGQFSIPSVIPGRYSLKAMCSSFLPSMRENIRIRRGTIVNLTLNTLYEVMQWLPTQPRSANAQKDDWEWTLRSAANRPLLRWLEDGPLVVVSEGSGKPRLKARLVATGQQGTFGESGERITAAVENTPSNSRELLARVDFAPNTDGGMESMLGFRQDLGISGSVQSVAAVAVHPEIEGQGGEGMEELAMRSWENFNLGDEFEGDAGSEQVIARFAANSPNTIVTALPFASFAWRSGNGDTVIRYRMTTLMHPMSDESGSAADYLPELASTSGNLTVQHGMHQEIGWDRETDTSGLTVAVFTDNVKDPVIEAATHLASGPASLLASSVLYDPVSGLIRATGPGYGAAGMTASVSHRLPGGNHICFGYANGAALSMPVAAGPMPLIAILGAAHPRHVQTYTLSLSGTLEGTGTKWRASYRWQPEDTVTAVAPFSADSIEPYFNLHLRQPLYIGRHEGMNGIEALIDVHNMLAEGYRPFVLSDGSVLIFAQDQRSVRAGLSFTF